MTEQHERSGILFKNARKEEPHQPDYVGSATINGETFELSAWIKEGRKGRFLGISFRSPRQIGPSQAPPPDRESTAPRRRPVPEKPSRDRIARTEGLRSKIPF